MAPTDKIALKSLRGQLPPNNYPTCASNLRVIVVMALFATIFVAVSPAFADCTCADSENRVCVEGPTGNGYQAFSVELLSSAIDQQAGERDFVYKVCQNPSNAAFCPTGEGYKDLSHIDLLISDIRSCAGSSVSLSVASSSNVADCSVGTSDPSCDITSFKVVKCDINGPFSDGDCFQFTLTVGGETAQASAPGPVYTISKAGTKCAQACILGPSCTDCNPPPPPEDKEFTRSPGFYSNHPSQTSKYLPISDVCGLNFDHFNAFPTSGSATQALCINAMSKYRKVSESGYNLDTLLRQLLAARLNVKVTNENGGSISAAHLQLIDSCNKICASGSTNSGEVSNCVDKLSEFNDDLDTLEPTPPEFANPGRAYPTECKKARDDQFLFFL